MESAEPKKKSTMTELPVLQTEEGLCVLSVMLLFCVVVVILVAWGFGVFMPIQEDSHTQKRSFWVRMQFIKQLIHSTNMEWKFELKHKNKVKIKWPVMKKWINGSAKSPMCVAIQRRYREYKWMEKKRMHMKCVRAHMSAPAKRALCNCFYSDKQLQWRAILSTHVPYPDRNFSNFLFYFSIRTIDHNESLQMAWCAHKPKHTCTFLFNQRSHANSDNRACAQHKLLLFLL